MQEKIQAIIQRRMGYIMGLLEATNNDILKREIKKHIWDLSDDITELVNNKEESQNEKRKHNQ